MVDVNSIMVGAVEIIKTIMLTIPFVLLLGFMFYNMFIKPRQRHYEAIIWEKRSSGQIVPQIIDKVIRLRNKEGYEPEYFLKTLKKPVIEPPEDFVQRINKPNGRYIERVNFLFMNGEFVPLKPEVRDLKLEYTPPSTSMRLFKEATLEKRRQKYAKDKGFFEKYQALISVAILVVGFIVLIYFGFEWATGVINGATGAAEKSASALEKIAEQLS